MSMLTERQIEDLKPLARTYIWWKTPEEALKTPYRVIAQVMDLGTYKDWIRLCSIVSNETLCDVIKHAQAGWFSPKRWNYWHIALKIGDPFHVPPLPARPLPPSAA